MTPTVGRVVLVYPDGHDRNSQPLPGIIAYVHSQALINVGVFDQNGRSFGLTSVKLVEPPDDVPPTGNCACWMPYQVQQQAKNDAAEKTNPSEKVATTKVNF